jgi:hypothetical protein
MVASRASATGTCAGRPTRHQAESSGRSTSLRGPGERPTRPLGTGGNGCYVLGADGCALDSAPSALAPGARRSAPARRPRDRARVVVRTGAQGPARAVGWPAGRQTVSPRRVADLADSLTWPVSETGESPAHPDEVTALTVSAHDVPSCAVEA